MLKHSKQRDCIVQFLKSRTDHPAAETVYLNIRQEIPNISLATVYRNLSLLADMGEINRLHTGQGPDRFDAMTKPHNHFVCSKCGEVIDLQMDKINQIMGMNGQPFMGRIDAHATFFYGVCPECLKMEKTS